MNMQTKICAMLVPCCLAAGIARAATGQQANALALVREGVPVSMIVIATNAAKAARFAALELQDHVRKMTGATLPIVTDDKPVEGTRILVGDSAQTRQRGLSGTELESQEYLIRFLPDALVLMGKDKADFGDFVHDYQERKSFVGWPSPYDDIGTMYAVYDFLRDYCGVKWINPTEHGTFVPKMQTLVVGGDGVQRKPFMHYRGGSAAEHSRYQRNGGYWSNPTDGARQYNELAFGEIHAAIADPRQRDIVKQARNLLFIYRMKGGGEKTFCNHSFYEYFDRFWHEESSFFVERRPAYFAKGYDGDIPPQLCYSNPDVIGKVVTDVRNYFDNGGYPTPMRGIPAPGYHWGENNYALEPMDNSAFCKCDDCASQYELERTDKKSQHSTYWFRFVNDVAKEIKKSHPEKIISTLAYMTHEGLPTDLVLEDNVAVHFCISANRMPFNPLLDEQLDRLREWRNQTDNDLYLWLYHCFPKEFADNGKFHCFPGHFAHELKRQFELFEELGVKGVFHCGFNGEVDNYVAYRLMDNAALDVDTILDEYFSVYGKPGPTLRRMYETIERRYCSPDSYPKRVNGEIDTNITFDSTWGSVGNAETMQALQQLMDEAYRLAETDQEKRMVELWDAGLWSYMREGRETYVTRMSYPLPEVNAPRVEAAGGDVNAVAWEQAAPLGDYWYQRGGNERSKFKMEGRICHDGEFLYLELTDHVDPAKLKVSAMIAAYDDWELFVAGQRAQPFRQYMIGPTALTAGISYGEVNWRQHVPATEYTEPAFGMKAVSDTTGDAWILRLAFPLSSLIERPLQSGDDFYMNAVRVRNPALAGEPRYGIDTWVAYTTVKDVDRMGKIHLEK